MGHVDIEHMSIRRRLPGYTDVAVAAVMLGVLYYVALRVRIWEDFFAESGPAVQHLMAGDLHGFLALTPAYGGSLLLSAPSLALGGALGGLDGAYRLESLFCMATVTVLALALARIQRSQGRSILSRWLLIAVLVASPAADWALKEGHPEELLAAALCVGGMLLVVRGRITSGAILLGLAVASKQWALLALPLALAAAPGNRGRFSLAAAAAVLGLSLPLALASAGNFVAVNRGLASAPFIFHPEQIWWTLHLDYIRPLGGPHSTIFGPAPIALVARYSHPLIGLIAALSGVAYWLRRRHVQPSDALLMLALVLLLRCMLDPWNVLYYQFPFLVALAAWEASSHRRAPLFTLAASFLVWTSFRPVNTTSSGDITNLFYLTWALPAAVLMGWRSLRLPLPRARYETTVSSLPSRLRIS
jgi:hypothetical protein